MTLRSFVPSFLTVLVLNACAVPNGDCVKSSGGWFGAVSIDMDCDGKDSGAPDDTAVIDTNETGDADTDTDTDSDSDTNETGDTDTAAPIDADGDGFNAGEDCNDEDAAINPDAVEICDSVDNNCNGDVDGGATDQATYYADDDGDSYGDAAATVNDCSAPAGYVESGTDCDDTDSTVHPYAVEDCSDSKDMNCDGSFGTADADGDGVPACEDCDDTNAVMFPGGTEVCDGFDNDCEGTTDIDATDSLTWYEDSDSDSFGNSAVSALACTEPSGYVADNTDCNDTNTGINPGEAEACNGADDNCSGVADEGLAFATYYADSDSDGYGDSAVSSSTCDGAPSGTTADNTDCNDGDSGINPGELEVCNLVDDDCSGSVDDSAVDALDWYRDADNDGYGNASISIVYCSEPSGYTADATDCDDSSNDIYPGNIEWCDGEDNDCTGSSDDGDYDADGYDVCADCDDGNASLNPGEPEVCDGDDNDCDGVVDDGLGTTYYADTDGDGYGNSASSTSACSGAPAGYVANATDCNDSDAGINPGATEVCNSTDDNCDGATDEGVTTVYYLDDDVDGYGDASVTDEACSAPAGYVTDDTDCDDDRDYVSPAEAQECYSGLDEDCDGGVGFADSTCNSATTENLFTNSGSWNGETSPGVADTGGWRTLSGAAFVSDCTSANADQCSLSFTGPGSWSVTSDTSATAATAYFMFSATSDAASTIVSYSVGSSGSRSYDASNLGWGHAVYSPFTQTTAGTVTFTFSVSESETVLIDSIVFQQ